MGGLRYCYGVATVLRRCCTLGYPLYIPCTSLVHPFYSRRDFGDPPMPPPGSGPVPTALVWPLFKGNRILRRIGGGVILLPVLTAIYSWPLLTRTWFRAASRR